MSAGESTPRLSRRAVLAGSAAAAIAAPALSRAAGTADGLDEMFRARIAEAGISGAVAAFMRRGEAPRILTAGYANLPFQAPVTPDTLFHVGSVGKHITAVAALRLVEAGRLALDAPIGRYMAAVPPAWRAVPVATILNHSSGIPDYQQIIWDRPADRATFFADAAGHPLDFAPGTAWRYCNRAFTLLGYIIEDLSGQSYAAVIADLFARAGLRTSRVDDGEAVIRNRADGYELRDGRWFRATSMSTTISSVAAGGILLSAPDFATWKNALAGDALLSDRSRALTMTPSRFSNGLPCAYNMGWFLDRLPDGRAFRHHSGSVSGFQCQNIEIPSAGVATMLLCNAENDHIGPLTVALAETFAPGSTPLGLTPLVDDAPRLTELAHGIVARVLPWELSLFTPELQLLIKKFGDEAIDWLGTTGPVIGPFVLVQRDDVGGVRRRRYRTDTPTGVQHVIVSYDRSGLIFEIVVL